MLKYLKVINDMILLVYSPFLRMRNNQTKMKPFLHMKKNPTNN